MKKLLRLFILLFAGVGCILLFGLVLVYVNYTSGRAVPTFPRVTITTTTSEATGVVNQPVVVFGEASDPDGIASAELWVNGARVAAQANTDTNQAPFEISQSWIPDGPGNYLFLLRGVDRRGFAGESTPVMIQISERSYQPDPAMHGQYFVQAGDTIESIAAQFGTTPEEIRRLNPDLGDLASGASILVPPAPEAPASTSGPPPPSGAGAAPPPAGGSDEPPHVSPPPPPSPEGGAPAVPASAPWWRSLPLPSSFGCILNPAMCASPVGGGSPSLPVSDVHASLVDACQTSVSWTDNSSDETGYRVYRLVMRPRFRSDLLALLSPVPGNGTRSTFTDTTTPTGQFFYAIATINSLGEEVWGAPSEQITTTCPSSTASGSHSLDVEALQMTVNDSSIDRLYCYVSLAGSPFERIPEGASGFITMEGGTWDIATYASGDNKRTLMTDGTTSLEIVAECLGRQGDTLINLGRFTRSHSPEEWDGRMLTAGPDSGAFNVTYRIQPTPPAGSGGRGGGMDPTVPAPFNLRATDSLTSCTRAADDMILCGITNEPGLAWDYNMDPGMPRPPLYFKVYSRAAGSSTASLSYTTLDNHMSAPRADCEHAFYSVSAVVEIDPSTATEIESPASETLETLPTCGQLEITLTDMWVYGGGEDAYGSFWFNGVPVVWNLGPCAGGTLCGGAPSYTSVGETTAYNWADMFLSVNRGRYGPGHNVFRVPIHDGEPLRMTLQLWDHYVVGSDEVWCGYYSNRAHSILAARSLTEWLAVDQDVLAYDGATVPLSLGAIGCDINLHVRGIP